MKTLRHFYFLLGLLGLLLLAQPLLHAQNPYERLGIQSDPLTLSQGRYQEFFPNDTLVQIGPVIFNTITQEVVGFVEPDGSELNFPADVASRWLSPDPLAAKYPEMSPYVGMGNNPIIYIDPDGRYIYLVIYGEVIKYTPALHKSIKSSDDVTQQALATAVNALIYGQKSDPWGKENNPLQRNLSDPNHDIYLVVGQPKGGESAALPNAFKFNKGTAESFEFDKEAFLSYMQKANPGATFSDEFLPRFEALNGTDISKSGGGEFSMVALADAAFGAQPDAAAVFLGGEVTKENQIYEGALIIIHEIGAHINERNNRKNPGGVHTVPDSKRSDWEPENLNNDAYFKETISKYRNTKN